AGAAARAVLDRSRGATARAAAGDVRGAQPDQRPDARRARLPPPRPFVLRHHVVGLLIAFSIDSVRARTYEATDPRRGRKEGGKPSLPRSCKGGRTRSRPLLPERREREGTGGG